MPRSSPAAGIGALGSAPARFFHPSAKIREKFPNNDKRRLEGVIITGQGTFKVNRRQQECYCVRIDEFDDGTIFHIVRGKLRIDQAAAVPLSWKCRRFRCRQQLVLTTCLRIFPTRCRVLRYLLISPYASANFRLVVVSIDKTVAT